MLLRFLSFIAFKAEETAGVGTPPEPVATPPVETPAPQPGPWASDLAEYLGADNTEAIAAADRYMREKVQPRITTLETDSAPARALYKDLTTDPEATLREVVTELWGAEEAEKFAAIFAEEETPEPETPEGTTPPADEPPEWAQPLLERDQAQREQDAIAEGERLYAQVLTELRTAHPDLTDHDMEHIHPFMASADNPEAAYAGYAAFKASLLGNSTPEPAADPVTAPPVLGADGAAPAVPPVAKEYKNIDEAMDDWFAERAAVAPPVVGSA